MKLFEPKSVHGPHPDPAEQAASEFLRRVSRAPDESGESSHTEALCDPRAAAAFEKVADIWEGVGRSANRPEFLALREQAIARARRASQLRWSQPWGVLQRWRALVAGIAAIALTGGAVWQVSPYGFRPGVSKTGIGEQRTLELSDHTRVALDSSTRIRTTMTADARTVEITQGQAQFFVAHEVARPFKVIAGGHTIVALGTVFTVEYDAHFVRVDMMEGRVAVVAPDAIELTAGEEARFSPDGRATVTPKADIEAATAWRGGKVIFRAERLGEAIQRLNRYSRVQLQIDDAELADLRVSGVFEAGDNRGFADAMMAYLPVLADYSQGDVIKLRPKQDTALR
jgi:transmembrane sensor